MAFLISSRGSNGVCQSLKDLTLHHPGLCASVKVSKCSEPTVDLDESVNQLKSNLGAFKEGYKLQMCIFHTLSL